MRTDSSPNSAGSSSADATANTSKSIAAFFNHHPIKGFLAEAEGELLYSFAKKAKTLGPCLEVGSYCGKSTVYMGFACRETDNTLYAVDHHRGSEEHQCGELFHDADLFDVNQQRMNSFPAFQYTLQLAKLESTVVPIVAASELVVKHWGTPLGMVFIDGGHSYETSYRDCATWCKQLRPGGFLAIHDIFEKPEDGGQGPYLAMNAVLERGDFIERARVQSLVILQRIAEAV